MIKANAFLHKSLSQPKLPSVSDDLAYAGVRLYRGMGYVARGSLVYRLMSADSGSYFGLSTADDRKLKVRFG